MKNLVFWLKHFFQDKKLGILIKMFSFSVKIPGFSIKILGFLIEILAFSIEILGSDYRSSQREVFCKNDVLNNFVKFTGKNLYRNLFFLTKRLQQRQQNRLSYQARRCLFDSEKESLKVTWKTLYFKPVLKNFLN